MSSSVVISDSSDKEFLEILKDKICYDIWNDCRIIFTNCVKNSKIDQSHFENIYKINSNIQQYFEKEYFALTEKYNGHYFSYYVLGYFYDKIENYDIAEACYKLCISKYHLCDAYLNLGIIYYKCNKIDDAKNILRNCLKYIPNDVRILNFLGTLYYVEKDYVNAIELYNKCIQSNKNNKTSSLKNVLNNIGFSYSAIGKCKKALKYFDDGLNLICNGENTQTIEKLDFQLLQNKLINYDYLYDCHENVYQNFLKVNTILHTINVCTRRLPENRTIENKKIKIGYVSPDLRLHVCAHFIKPILEHFDKNIFDVYCYANVVIEDDMSKTFKNLNGIHWFNISNLTTSGIYNLIHTHDIDILIDLAGHTNGNNLDVFAKKPAPIQITYLGYPNTTGLTCMDYRITDHYADPISSTQKYTETLLRMPKCFICYSITKDIKLYPINPVKHKTITFGVFNKMNKHNKYTFKAWYEIVKNVPNSILLIKRDTKVDYNTKIKSLKKIGFTDEQLRIIDHIPDDVSYKQMYNNIDICLDTFPYSGTTTSCDGFLMGMPIVTYSIPNRHVSNVTASLLYNMGFPELVAKSINEYIDISIKLANDMDKIIFYKQTIRQKFMELMNEKNFVRDFDKLLYQTYQNFIE